MHSLHVNQSLFGDETHGITYIYTIESFPYVMVAQTTGMQCVCA